MRRVERKIFKRFALSFLIVLVLPVTVFVFFFLDTYQDYFQKRIEEQAKNTLEATARELDRQIEGLHAIVEYDSLLPFMEPYMIARDLTGKNVTTMLMSEEAVHAIVDNVRYYNLLQPNRIYTSSGTYSVKYFASLVIKVKEPEEIIQSWKSIDSEGWLLWEQNDEQEEGGDNLQYVIKNKTGEWWIFTISLEELQSVIGEKNAITRFMDHEGNTLYLSEGELAADKGGSIEIAVESANNYFKLTRTISEKSLFQEVEVLQDRFLVLTVLILLSGFALVLMLTFYNEHPIRKLLGVFREKVQDIPESVHGLDVFMFTLNDMEKRLEALNCKQTRERLMLQLIFGNNCNNKHFCKALEEAGIFKCATCYRAVVAVMEKEDYKDKLGLYLEMLVGNAYEFYVFDSFYGNVVVILFGMPEEAEHNLEKELNKVADAIESNLDDNISFCVGKCYSRLDEICQSYKEATLCSMNIEHEKGKKVIYYKEIPGEEKKLQYPTEELHMLYDALIDIDFKKASMLTDVLLGILESNSDNRFISVSLYYDVLNTYYRARAKLEVDAEFVSLDLDLLNVHDVQPAPQMISNIREQFQLYIDSIKENKKKKNMIPDVIEFIDTNAEICDLTVSMIADYFDISISNLSHQFKAQMDCTISEYITEKKFSYVCKLLVETEHSVQEIAEKAGYSQANSFIRKFRQKYGMTPIEYRNSERAGK